MSSTSTGLQATERLFSRERGTPMEEHVPPADLNDIALFVKVIDKGGFAKAAREARLPTSTVSRAVARLEDAVGARLLHRTTRNVTACAIKADAAAIRNAGAMPRGSSARAKPAKKAAPKKK